MKPRLPARYRWLSAEGAGAYAVVHRAFDVELGVDVAVKVLSANWVRRSEVVDDFLAEARRLRSLSLSSVIDVHDLGFTVEGSPYMVMDFADGGSLRSRIDWLESRAWSGGRNVAAVAGLTERLAETLGAFHEAGFVHRDLKPENLLLISSSVPASAPPFVSRNERLVLGDLGLATDHANANEPRGTRGYRSESLVGIRGDLAAATAVVLRVLRGSEGTGGEVDRAAWESFEVLRAEPPPTASDWARRMLELLDARA